MHQLTNTYNLKFLFTDARSGTQMSSEKKLARYSIHMQVTKQKFRWWTGPDNNL